MIILLNLLRSNFKEILLLIGGYIIISKLSKIGKIENEQNLTFDEQRTIKQATISRDRAKSIADNFYTAMVTYMGGTDEEKIYAQLDKLKVQADFDLVYNEFGKKQYSFTWGNQGDPITSDNVDLIRIMANELNSSEQEYIKQKYPHLTIF